MVLREFFDVMVYLDPLEVLRREWKLKRDTTRRGYTADEVLAELDRRERDSERFIRPQREFADVVVRFSSALPGERTESSTNRLNARLVLRPTIPHPDLTYLVNEASPDERGIRLELGRDAGRPVAFLAIDRDVNARQTRELEEVIWRHLPECERVNAERLGRFSTAASSGTAISSR